MSYYAYLSNQHFLPQKSNYLYPRCAEYCYQHEPLRAFFFSFKQQTQSSFFFSRGLFVQLKVKNRNKKARESASFLRGGGGKNNWQRYLFTQFPYPPCINVDARWGSACSFLKTHSNYLSLHTSESPPGLA